MVASILVELSHVFIDTNIAGREYQLEAIKSVCETFEEGHAEEARSVPVEQIEDGIAGDGNVNRAAGGYCKGNEKSEKAQVLSCFHALSHIGARN